VISPQVVRAYLDLLTHGITLIRSYCGTHPDLTFDLADALHNVPVLVADPLGWQGGDENYRQVYLRPVDHRWRSERLALERYLDERISHHQAADHNG
jgi:hypothetical protein